MDKFRIYWSLQYQATLAFCSSTLWHFVPCGITVSTLPSQFPMAISIQTQNRGKFLLACYVFHRNQKLYVGFRFEIPMMTGRFNVLLGSSEELKCRLLELPFRGRRLSMFILLPDQDRIRNIGDKRSNPNKLPNLTQLERNLNAENLKRLFSTLKATRIIILLWFCRADFQFSNL